MPYKWRRICWIWVSRTKVLALNILEVYLDARTIQNLTIFLCSGSRLYYYTQWKEVLLLEKHKKISEITHKNIDIFSFFISNQNRVCLYSIFIKKWKKIKFSYILWWMWVKYHHKHRRRQKSQTVYKKFSPLLVNVPTFSYTE